MDALTQKVYVQQRKQRKMAIMGPAIIVDPSSIMQSTLRTQPGVLVGPFTFVIRNVARTCTGSRSIA